MDAGADIMVNAKEFTPQFDLWAQDGTNRHMANFLPRCWKAFGWLLLQPMMRTLTILSISKPVSADLLQRVVDAPKRAIMPSIIDRSR